MIAVPCGLLSPVVAMIWKDLAPAASALAASLFQAAQVGRTADSDDAGFCRSAG